MIISRNREKRFGIRNWTANKLIKSAKEDEQRARESLSAFNSDKLSNRNIENSLINNLRSKGIKLKKVDAKPSYNYETDEIRYLPDRVDSLAHERGHYENTKSSNKNIRETAELNNRPQFRAAHKNYLSAGKFINNAQKRNQLPLEVKKK